MISPVTAGLFLSHYRQQLDYTPYPLHWRTPDMSCTRQSPCLAYYKQYAPSHEGQKPRHRESPAESSRQISPRDSRAAAGPSGTACGSRSWNQH